MNHQSEIHKKMMRGESIPAYRSGPVTITRPAERPKWQRAMDSMDGVCTSIGEPLTEGQRTVLAGSLAVWFEQ